MTPTADKIKEIYAQVETLDDNLNHYQKMIHELYEKLDKLYKENSKPPDPEPLECIVTVNRDTGKPCGAYALDETQDDGIPLVVAAGYRPVKVHEVTPQTKQDELDAKRYRKLKELHCATAPQWIYTSWRWDEMIDKVMEE